METNMATIVIEGMATETDPVLSAREDCDAVVFEGTDPVELLACREDADGALINAMGSTWVVRVASGDPNAEYTEEVWETIALPWCERYNAAYRARAAELAVQS